MFYHQIRYTAAPAAAVVAAALVRSSNGGGRRPYRVASGRHDTMRSATDAAWQPEMNYGRSRVPTATRCCTCFVVSRAEEVVSREISCVYCTTNTRRLMWQAVT